MSEESDNTPHYLVKVDDGSVTAVGGPLNGARFAPNTRRLDVGDWKYALQDVYLPPEYEAPVSGPGKPLTITSAERDAYDAETARIEAAKTQSVPVVPAFAEIVVIDNDQSDIDVSANADVSANVDVLEDQSEQAHNQAADSGDEADVADGGEPAGIVAEVVDLVVDTFEPTKPVKPVKKTAAKPRK